MNTIIIIPYRKREVHLKYFIDNSAPLLKKHMENMKIVIVEQAGEKPFNRGKLLNVGFEKYKNECKYIMTHDVDINPTKETIEKLYIKKVGNNEIMGIYTSCSNTLGGIIKLNKNIFNKINGFPNNIWGWGVEDKVLQNRAEFKKVNITKNILNNNPKKDAYFTIFNNINDRDRRFEPGHHLFHYNKWNSLSNIEKEKTIIGNGLTSLDYKLIKKEIIEEGVIEKIVVDI